MAKEDLLKESCSTLKGKSSRPQTKKNIIPFSPPVFPRKDQNCFETLRTNLIWKEIFQVYFTELLQPFPSVITINIQGRLSSNKSWTKVRVILILSCPWFETSFKDVPALRFVEVRSVWALGSSSDGRQPHREPSL